MSYEFYITPEEYEVAERNGISAVRLEQRIRDYGWSKKKAITKPPMEMKPLNEKYAALAEKNGISRETFRSRVRKYGMTNEEAAMKSLQDRKKAARTLHRRRRKYPDELLKLAEKNGISYSTFISRINRSKWDPYEAAVTPVINPAEMGRRRSRMWRENGWSW